MKRLRGKLDNRGVGIVTVMVAIMFLTALGSVLLMLSYTASEMRASDRIGKKNLYDASAVMEEINAGVQEACSQAIVNSYGETLIRYNDYGVNVTREFQKKYRDFLRDCCYEIDEEDGTGVWRAKESASDRCLIYLAENGNYRYDLSVITDLIKLADSDNYRIFCVDEANEEIDLDADMSIRGGLVENIKGVTITEEQTDGSNKTYYDCVATGLKGETLDIILKGVGVEYTGKGRTTTVISDITIKIPSIGYSNNVYSETGINENACIVQGSLIHYASAQPSVIYGGAYFGSVQTKGSGVLKFDKKDSDDSLFVIGSSIEIDGAGIGSDSRLIVGSNSDIWANDVNLNVSGSSVSLLGNTYIANDLLLQGNNSKATLAGTYYGFGTGKSVDAEGNLNGIDSKKSSSIIANGKNSTLDIDGLETLTLAGYAFVGNNNYYQTSQSIAGKEDQRAYLIPAELVSYDYITSNDKEVLGKTIKTNPESISKSTVDDIKSWSWHVSSTDYLWAKGACKAEDYDMQVKPVVEHLAGSSQYLVYAFAVFGDSNGYTSQENANRYFKDYFKYNSAEINKYMSNYITVIGRSEIANVMGDSYYYDSNKGQVQIENYYNNASALESDADAQAIQYELLRTSLNQKDTYEKGDNPLSYLLSEDLTDLPNNYIEYKNADEKTVAVASNKDILITNKMSADGTDEIYFKNGSTWTKITNVVTNKDSNGNPTASVCMIITTGSITVQGSSYNGLLCTEQNLELKDGAILNRDPKTVTSAYTAKDSSGGTISDYLNEGVGEGERAGRAWVVSDLVGYDNWSRKTEM